MISDFDLSGRTALVTGGARGIGSGIVEVFLEAGAGVVVNSLTDTYAKPFVESLDARYPGKVTNVLADATTSDGSQLLVEETCKVLGHIDILVNGVGDGAFTGSLAPLPDAPDAKVYEAAEIDKILALNLMSAVHCTRAVAAGMLERRSGRIISLVSNAAAYGSATNSIYAAGKAGIVGLTKSLSRAWAPLGVTVNAISPGVYLDYNVMPKAETDILEDRFLPKIPLGRLGEFREVGLLALYLASAAGEYMTGQVLTLDGGLGGA